MRSLHNRHGLVCMVSDTEVVVPRRDPGVGDTQGAGHRRRADVHHQQRARGVPQRAPAASPGQGRHQHLRGLRAQPPRLLPLLLPRVQGTSSPAHRLASSVALRVSRRLVAPNAPPSSFFVYTAQIVGTARGYRPKKKHGSGGGGGGGNKRKRAALKDVRSDSEESCTSTSGASSDKSSVVQSFSPSTPLPTSASYRRPGNKRRKGVPHRSPFGSLIVEF
jgi:hypothetical protein